MIGASQISRIHSEINEGSVGSLLKESRRENYNQMMVALKLLPLDGKWTLMFSDSSITVHTRTFKKTIKISTNARVYVDRRMKSGSVKSETFSFSNMTKAINKVNELFHQMNKTNEVANEQSSKSESPEAA